MTEFIKTLNLLKSKKRSELREMVIASNVKNKELIINLIDIEEGLDVISEELNLVKEFQKYLDLFKTNRSKNPDFSLQLLSDYRYFLLIKTFYSNIEANYPESFGYFDKKE